MDQAGAFVESVSVWLMRSIAIGWICDGDGDGNCDAGAYLKMLWRLRTNGHVMMISGDIQTTADDASPSSLSPSLALVHTCLRAAAGDTRCVIAAAEALHCRSRPNSKPKTDEVCAAWRCSCQCSAVISIIATAINITATTTRCEGG
jgi:hypothetical protein